MPKYEGVYQDAKGSWYFKIFQGRDPLTRKPTSVARRGFTTAADASGARREFLERAVADVEGGERGGRL